MGENSKIEWTHHTFNPWIGCTKVAEGCKHCYAESYAIDLMVLGAANAAELLTPSPWPDLEEQRQILDGFKGLIERKIIPEELTPDSWSRFAENIQAFLGRRQGRPISAPEVIELCADKSREFTQFTFPRLVSLHQFVMGIVLENTNHRVSNDYTPLLTDEFRQVFPRVAGLVGFNIDG